MYFDHDYNRGQGKSRDHNRGVLFVAHAACFPGGIPYTGRLRVDHLLAGRRRPVRRLFGGTLTVETNASRHEIMTKE